MLWLLSNALCISFEKKKKKTQVKPNKTESFCTANNSAVPNMTSWNYVGESKQDFEK